MPYVSGYQHQAFVSYAHIDDEPLSGAEKGWVTTLVRNLETVVRQKLGDKTFEIWMDHELAGNAPLTPALVGALSQTATLVVVMSPGYLDSEWCRRERETFLGMVRGRLEAGQRVFVIHYDKMDRDDLPLEFRDLIGYPFWVQDREQKVARTLGIPVPLPNETEYYCRVNQLAHEMAQELKRLRGAAASTPAPSAVRGRVFLAEVTDDLEPRREEVRRYLNQAGLEVLPGSLYPRDEPAEFERVMRSDLARCRLFVQLLSGFTGRKPAGLPQGYPMYQAEIARSAGLSILQWRARDTDPTTVQDAAQRELLQGESVRVCGMEEFKKAIADEAEREEKPATPRDPGDALIFVNTDAPDRSLAGQVARCLLDQGVGYSMPLKSGAPDEIRTDLEENLLTCDGVLMIYGTSTPAWVRSQLRQCRKVLSRRERRMSAIAVFEGPPPEKAGLDLAWPDLQWLNCRNGLELSSVRGFIDKVRSENP